MGKRRNILVMVLAVAVPIGLAWVLIPSGPANPTYDGKPVSYWLRDPRIQDPNIRPGLPAHFPRMDARAVPYLMMALEKRDGFFHRNYEGAWRSMPLWLQSDLPEPFNASRLRMAAAIQLDMLGNDAKPAIPALIRAMKGDDDYYLRGRAAGVLGNVGRNDKSATEALIGALKDKEPTVRSSVVLALGSMGTNDKTVMDALVGALRDKDPWARVQMAQSLLVTGANNRAAIEALAESLKENDRTVRLIAIAALSNAGSTTNASQAKDALVEALKGKDAAVRLKAGEALKRIDPEAAGKERVK